MNKYLSCETKYLCYSNFYSPLKKIVLFLFSWIYHKLTENKQMLALSATYPEYLAQQLTQYMRDPVFVRLNRKDVALHGKWICYIRSLLHK